MSAPAQIIILPVPVGGSPAWSRSVRPVYPPPLKSKRPHWLQQHIPGPTRVELQREVRQSLEHSKPQIEALRRLAP
jgi:hypothetical protein